MFSEVSENTVLSVSELGEFVKAALNQSFGTEGIWVKGVIASYSAHSSGHHYLDLQEFAELASAAPVATVSCVIWKTRAPFLLSQINSTPLGTLRNGLSLVARVKPNFWPKGGRLSFQIEEIDFGLSQMANLQAKEKIRTKLRQLGIWDHNHDLQTPLVPLRVGLVTAQGSAAESDFLGELTRSGFAFKVTYRPASTAGEAAPIQISTSIRQLQRSELDLICLVRGGGSMSDLSVFDTDEVVTSVAASSIPVWVGIGHSTDTTLVEEVANRYLDVPQSVARAVVTRVQEFLDEIDQLRQKIRDLGRSGLELARLQLAEIAHQSVRGPIELTHLHDMRIGQYLERIKGGTVLATANARSELSVTCHVINAAGGHLIAEQLRQMEALAGLPKANSLSVLREQSHVMDLLESYTRASDPEEMSKRGFSLLASESGYLIRAIDEIEVGQRIKGIVGHSSFVATVNEKTTNVEHKERGGAGV
ncbi:MAG: exodeoxyribonuclease VII large subunit [Actinomycetota bacterium]|nr:exodeoxyribonuclease VII large subunit [Actinomycetota bacterium]